MTSEVSEQDILEFMDDVSTWDMAIARERLSTEHDHAVEVDGRIMNVNIQGSGDSVIVLLPGRGVTAPSYDMAPLIDQLKGDATVCTIEPFGSGLSDMTDEPRTSTNIVHEIHAALAGLGFTKYTLVGHSIAGIYTLEYANTYPEEVALIVGIDSATPGMDKLISPELMEATSQHSEPTPYDVDDDIGDVVGYEYTERDRLAIRALHELNKSNDSIFEAQKKQAPMGGERAPKPYDTMRYPESIPVRFYLSSESSGMADWYVEEHTKQLTPQPGSGVIVLEGGHFLHHTKSAQIAKGVLSVAT